MRITVLVQISVGGVEAATLLVHIAAGAVGIMTGYIALAAARGGRPHRGVGVLVVYAMVVMALFAAWP